MTLNECKWLYADWCHCPDFEEQELCPFKMDKDEIAKMMCKKYKGVVKVNERM